MLAGAILWEVITMIFLAGKSIAVERMKADKAGISPDISVDHDYYDQGQHPGSGKHPMQGPKQAEQKAKEVRDAIKPSGYEIGYEGVMGKSSDKGDTTFDKKTKLAIGGAAKKRLGMTDD